MGRLPVILGVILSMCVGCRAAEPVQEPPANSETGQIGGTFILIDQNGRTVTDQDFQGRFLLVTFGYTHCPDICPTTLMTIASAMNFLGDDAKSVRAAFITVDPERDTADQLKDYVGSFGPEFVGLTGPQAFIDSVAQKYNVTSKKVPSPSGDYSIDHTAGIFLMGPDGAFIQRFAHDMPARDLAAAMRAAMRGRKS